MTSFEGMPENLKKHTQMYDVQSPVQSTPIPSITSKTLIPHYFI